MYAMVYICIISSIFIHSIGQSFVYNCSNENLLTETHHQIAVAFLDYIAASMNSEVRGSHFEQQHAEIRHLGVLVIRDHLHSKRSQIWRK